MDFSHLYSTRPIKSVDEDAADIVSTFNGLFKSKKKGIKLINYHQGLPLCFPASIEGVEHGMIDIDLHPHQAVALERDRYTFITCDAFTFPVGAKVQFINIRKRVATLVGFFFAEIMAEHRQAIRLMLNPPTGASFKSALGTVKGKLYDLSVVGAAVLIERAVDIADDVELELHFMLPNIIQETAKAVIVPARYVGTSRLDGSCLVRFAITPDKQVEQSISQYLFQRQVEIIRDLKNSQPDPHAH